MNRKGRVASLRIYNIDHPYGKQVSQIEVIEGEGICGDRHAKGGERQISLQDARLKGWNEKQGQQGICFRKFNENLAIEGIDFARLPFGAVLVIGSAKLEVSSWKKRCYQGQCALYNSGKDCPLPGSCLFATVLQSGIILENQPVLVLQEKN